MASCDRPMGEKRNERLRTTTPHNQEFEFVRPAKKGCAQRNVLSGSDADGNKRATSLWQRGEHAKLHNRNCMTRLNTHDNTHKQKPVRGVPTALQTSTSQQEGLVSGTQYKKRKHNSRGWACSVRQRPNARNHGTHRMLKLRWWR